MGTQSDRPVAIVTGASRGIGSGIARQLAEDGYATVVNYNRSKPKADLVVAEITSQGGVAVALQADVGSSEDRHRLVDETLGKWGRIDCLVNNAGITSPGRKDVLEATEENWDLVFDTNLKGPFFLAQRCANEMIDVAATERGVIINVSSISAYAVSMNRPDYCIAKSAMEMMTWLFASRLADHNIKVFDVCPGVIDSDMTAPVREKYDALIADGLSPIRRWGEPDDVAQAVSLLARGMMPFCTGQRINIDGGFHIRRL